jgi:hypothetical protein
MMSGRNWLKTVFGAVAQKAFVVPEGILPKPIEVTESEDEGTARCRVFLIRYPEGPTAPLGPDCGLPRMYSVHPDTTTPRQKDGAYFVVAAVDVSDPEKTPGTVKVWCHYAWMRPDALPNGKPVP